MQKKVSIITPCYNGEKFVSRYLDSVLNQTYDNIELIFINDGSTDNTEEIVKSYSNKFINRGMKLIYIYKKNEGQAKALNEGLKIFTGEYLTWPDSDDILEKDSIEKKVKFLEENCEYGLVRTDASIVNENNLEDIIYKFGDRPNKFSTDIFHDLIIEKMYLCCGCYMVRTSALKDVNPGLDIYCSNGGQNWQMLLPITYKYKCGYIDESLYTYVVRDESHSHGVKGLSDLLNRCDQHQDILINTINRIDMDYKENQKNISLIKEKYIRKKMNLGITYRNKELAKDNYNLLKKEYNVTYKDKVNFLQCQNLIFNIIIRVLRKIKGVMEI